jgi:glutamate synthase (NADPH/NADH) small chain
MSAPSELKAEFDAVLLTGGSRTPAATCRCRGATWTACTSRWSSCRSRTRSTPATSSRARSAPTGKHVIVIGGGDTGSDCVGTSNRHGAASVTQFELMPQPPEQENKPLTWPYWPIKLRTSSSHEEGCEREFAISTKEFTGEQGQGHRPEDRAGRMAGRQDVEVPGTEKDLQGRPGAAGHGLRQPGGQRAGGLRRRQGRRGNAKAGTDGRGRLRTNVDKVFAAGDMRRGQSLVVWAIREGRQAARAVDEFLMGAARCRAELLTRVTRPLRAAF